MLMMTDAPYLPPPQPVRTPIAERDLVRWLSTAQPGDQLTYHRGFLVVDTSSTTSRLSACNRQILQRVANRVADLVARGLVQAVQRRHAEGDCSYLVIASKRLNSARRRLGQALPELQSGNAA
jgi:hypothetical protein